MTELVTLKSGRRVLHVKTGGLYRIVSSKALLEADLTPMVIYQEVNGEKIWIRPLEEFRDGRFINEPLKG